MSSKKKIIISISAFAVLVLAAVVAVVAVLAAQSVKVTSTITVKYNAVEVAANLTAKYKIGDAGTATDIDSTLTGFDGTETGDAANKTTADLELKNNELTSAHKYIEFIFTFTNKGSHEYTATLVLPATSTNFTLSYEVPNAGGATKVNNLSFKVAGNTTIPVTYTVRYTITDLAKDASIDGNFEWTLATV